MTTMLSLVQQATGEMGLAVPTQVAGNTATDIVQILALLNGLGNQLIREYQWQTATVEYRFTLQYITTTGNTTNNSLVVTNIGNTTGLDSTYGIIGTGINQDTYVSTLDSPTQVTMSLVASSTEIGTSLTFGKSKYSFPSDFDRLIDRTDWDKSQHWEMIGPETPQQWQWLKSGYISSGPRVRFRPLGGYFQIWPLATSNDVLGFEYISKNWAMSSIGVGQSSFLADTDTCIFPDRLMVAGLKLKYFEIKGFDTTAMARDYMSQLDIAKANDAGSPNLSMAPRLSTVLIGVNNLPDSGYGA